MAKPDKDMDVTDMVRQSIVETKAKKSYVRDYSGEVFELTSDMLVDEYKFNQNESGELAGVAQCILQKYAKLLSLHK